MPESTLCETGCGTTNPKARGSNPLGRTPPTTQEHNASAEQESAETRGSAHRGTRAGQAVAQRGAAQGNAVARQRAVDAQRSIRLALRDALAAWEASPDRAALRRDLRSILTALEGES